LPAWKRAGGGAVVSNNGKQKKYSGWNSARRAGQSPRLAAEQPAIDIAFDPSVLQDKENPGGRSAPGVHFSVCHFDI